ncbi:MAG TPA: DeoR/GlpR family DNA-binding transcription regulator [Verrucomicrobiota bacterium]|nr:DeoR/GlpR family DNA-binding transcription regulator [Verrucomicrobiota bacterium]HNU52427.1 DeoR/GlpR family DNA-binding transcription regulator [Verrucomicrobiota bacterium]
MQPEERQHRIAEYLQRVEFASLEELARAVDVSQSTIRRDLTILENGGGIRRTHGGARVLDPRTDEFVFNARDTHQLAEKEAIGRACADLIQPGQSVIIDAGTTAFHAARYLESKRPMVITNSLPVANLYGSNNAVEVVVSGGVVYPRLGVLVGPLAIESFSRMHADVAIMGAGGITTDGVTNSHLLLIELQRTMMRVAQRIIFCLDHTKFGRRSMAPLCGLEAFQTVVTDQGAPQELVAALRNRSIEVVLAPSQPGGASEDAPPTPV